MMGNLGLIFIILISLSPLNGVKSENMPDERMAVSWHQEIKTGPLQKKIDQLRENEILLLPKGIYVGPIVIRIPGVTLKGEPGTVITAGEKDSVIVVEAENVTIKNLKITGSGISYTQADAGIALRSVDNVKLLNNEIVDCLFGIDVYSGKNLLIEGNTISSKNLEIGLRGDAMRLYNVSESEVLYNHWSHSRDVVSWYSKKILFKGNHGSDSRYSLHSMYSQNLRIQGNVFHRNTVGIFVMYGSDFIITNNFIERSLGATGMGIGLKEASNIFAQNNTINYSAVGVLVDNSPFKIGSRNWFHGNKLAFNEKGVVVNNDLPGGEFKNNVFLGNLEDVESENQKGSRSIWDKNFWDKYIGFDQDKNYVGDTPFIVRKYGDTLIGLNPKTAFFYGSPILTLLELIEKITNLGDPIVVLTDKNPQLLKEL
jgi:nitrous oxidase accessory protein